MIASRGLSSLSTNADTYSVNVPMPDTIGRTVFFFMLSHMDSMLSGLELGQVDTTRLGSIWTFGQCRMLRDVDGRE